MNDEQGKDFDISSSVSQQLTFFSCRNAFIKREHQKTISKYIYCIDFQISPYPGDYGKQPYKWIQKAQIIKTALAKLEAREMKKMRDK